MEKESRTTYEIRNRCLIIGLMGELDHHLAEQVRRECDAQISGYGIKHVIFNFEHTNFMDSSGVGVIVGRYKQVNLLGGQVFVINANSSILRILKISGLLNIIKIEESVDHIIETVK